MDTAVHIVIVTHNSMAEIPICIDFLSQQTARVASVVVVDSGSHDTAYLDTIRAVFPIEIIKEKNIGFAKANNLGFKSLKTRDENSLIIFLNPDAFLTTNFIEKLSQIFAAHPKKTCITGKLLSYDIQQQKASNRLDSTGIYRKWYGRWYDRGQGQTDHGQFNDASEPQALCGALICFLLSDLKTLGQDIFDRNFFLYKEDIELSLRLKKAGWRLLYEPSLLAYHCRGWQTDRKKIGFAHKHMSAKNEIRMYLKHPSPYICWALFKYFVVSVFRY